MDEDDFQMIISKEDYDQLKQFQTQNKELEATNTKLTKQIVIFTEKVKDLKKSLCVREEYIRHLLAECQLVTGSLLGEQGLEQDLTQSCYQDIVSFEQHGISSIEMRDALELFIEENQGIFEKLNKTVLKQKQQEKKIQSLEKQLDKYQAELKEEKAISEKVRNSANSNKMYEVETALEKMKSIQKQIKFLEERRSELDSQSTILSQKNKRLALENQKISKSAKKENCGEKSYVLKLMVDEYYAQLEKNLLKMGGLSDEEIGTVIANQMKGIVQYIDALCKKASRRY